MEEAILIQLNQHPVERDLIGKIILAYGELEMRLLDTVTAVLNGDNTTALRTLFRLRSESNRLQVADAISRPWFRSQQLEGQFDAATDAIYHCKNIRNQYAHCQWVSDPDGVLRFGDMEKAAKSSAGKCMIDMHPLTRATLEKQFAYFGYAQHAILWVTDQYRLKTKQKRLLADNQYILKPKRIPPPKLDSRGEPPTPRRRSGGNSTPR